MLMKCFEEFERHGIRSRVMMMARGVVARGEKKKRKKREKLSS